jgi:4-hydroxybutyryl-CoA dehydratase/vinylacetyl-CoA-Delta-isomerase
MALMTPEQFEVSLKELNPRVFMNGKKVDSILENKNTRTVIEANKASYKWALDPKYKDIMSCHSPLIDDVVNRYTHVSTSIDDLVKKAEAGTFTAEMLGTCIYRCVGYDAFHSLASTCWEMDRDLGTEYHPRFMEYLKMVQRKDLSVAGALTEPRGKRSQKTLDWPDPYLSLKLVDKNKDGIVVRGAKINISGAFASHELVVLPQAAHLEGEEDYAMPSPLQYLPIPRVSPMSASIPRIQRKGIRQMILKSLEILFLARGRPPWSSLRTFLCPGNGFFTVVNMIIPLNLCPALPRPIA